MRPSEERCALHLRLAELVADEERRALHLALATDTPDEELAARIEKAADHAAARGATRLGVDLATHSWRLTPPDEPAYDRLLAVATHLHDAGERQRLTDLLADRVESLPAGGSRVLGYHLLASGGIVHGNDEITALHEKALEEAGDIQPCRARAQSFLAENVAVIQVRDVAASDARAAEAVADSAHGDPERPAARGLHALVDPRPARPTGRRPRRALRGAVDRSAATSRATPSASPASATSGAARSSRRGRSSRRSWPAPRSGASRRRTRSRGCTCARWSCGSATGTRCSG